MEKARAVHDGGRSCNGGRAGEGTRRLSGRGRSLAAQTASTQAVAIRARLIRSVLGDLELGRRLKILAA